MPEPANTKPAADKPPPERPTLSADQIAAERKRGRNAGIVGFIGMALILGSVLWSGQISSDIKSDAPLIGGKPVGVATKQAVDQAQKTLDEANKTAPQQKQGKGKDKPKTGATGSDANAPSAATAKKQKDKVVEQKDRVEGMVNVSDNKGTFLAVTVLLSIGVMLMSVLFFHIYRAVKARRPETSIVFGVASVLGPLALGIALTVRALAIRDAAADFVSQSFPNLKAASDTVVDLQKGGAFDVVQVLVLAGGIALVLWLIKGNYDALNVGLLPKTIGFIGMALPLLFVVAPPITFFWVLALAGLCVGVWPGGLPPAWTEGRAIPWPKRQPAGGGSGGGGFFKPPPQQAGGERNGEVEAVGPGVKQASAESDGDGEPDAERGDGEVRQPHSGSRKKRKRRN